MMMDPVTDPLINFYSDESIPENILFNKDDDPLASIDLDLPLSSPTRLEQDLLTDMTENPEFEAELNNFLANFSSPSKNSSSTTLSSSSSSSSNNVHSSNIDLLDDFPFSPFEDESSKCKPAAIVESTASTIATPKLPVIINTSKISTQHLPKVVQLTKGNVVYIQAPNNSNKSQTNFIQVTNCLPTILINTPRTNIPSATATNVISHLQHEEKKPTVSMDDFQMDETEYIDHLPLTPSTSSESPDESISTSPDLENSFTKSRFHRSHPYHSNKSSSSMLTNLDKLPSSGPLLLTDEELKLIKQEGYQIPSKLPLTKTEEKILKKIRRKIKNKISAQESRRKKKEYVDTLERQIAKYIDENGALKERVSTMEKNQRSLMQELQSLRSMLGKGTPSTGKVLMVLCLFFAVLFGIWSPIVSKQSTEEFVRSSNDGSTSQQKSLTSSSGSSSSNSGKGSAGLRSSSVASSSTSVNSQSLIEQQDLIKQEPSYANYLPNTYKSRVLLSYDEQDNHSHGPYLPSSQKSKLNSNQQSSSTTGYTYSNSVEKYMNKRFKSNLNDDDEGIDERCTSSAQRSTFCKRSLPIESSPSIILSSSDSNHKVGRPNHTSNYRINEKVVVIDQMNEKLNSDSSLFEGKQLKIIRVERTAPAIAKRPMTVPL